MDEQMMDTGLDAGTDTGIEPADVPEETPPVPEEDLDLEEMPLFGDPDGEDGELEDAGDAPPEDTPEGEEPPEEERPAEEQPEQPQMVEVDGQPVPVQDLVQSAMLGQQAAREVLQLREQVERYKSVFQEYADMAGMDPEGYLSTLEQQKEEIRLQREAERLGTTPEALRQMREALRQREQAQEALQRQQQAQIAEQQRRERIQPYVELIQRYPELRDPAKMPPEVARQIQQGANPVIAYQDYMLGQRQAAQQVQARRQAVKGKSPGSASGVGDGQVDDALTAFMEEFEN